MQGLQGLRFASIICFFLASACANEKFQERGVANNTVAEAADEEPSAIEDTPTVETSLPIDVQETSAPSVVTETPKPPLFADCQTTPDRPIVGDLYQVPETTKSLPDFSKLKALKKICLTQLDIKARSFSEGFPGVEKLFEWFSLDLRFGVKVPEAGKWEFKLVADDGAVLWIDQTRVVDNDGVHSPQEKSGRMQLNAGVHQVRVGYFQGPRYNIALELYWKGPHDRAFSYIPAANLQRPQTTLLTSSPRLSSPD